MANSKRSRPMSNIDKHALREAAEKATPGPWCIARNGKTITSNQSHPVAVITEDFHRMLANGKTGGDAEFISAANPVTVLSLLDELEAKDKQIAELSASHGKLHEGMAAIYNAICENGASTSLSAILTFVKRAFEESKAAAGITVKGDSE